MELRVILTDEEGSKENLVNPQLDGTLERFPLVSHA